MLKLEYFYYVLEIFKVGSINGAAQNLYISQPYLSLSLKKTEEILGIKIFHRTNKGVIPTMAGKEFIKYCNEIIESINKANNLRKKFSEENQDFSVTTMPSFTMLDLIHDFKDICKNEYKSCNVTYNEVPNTFIAEKVMKGSTDIGLIYTTSTEHDIYMEKLKTMSLNFVPLVKEPLCAVVSKHNKLYSKDHIELNDLNEFDFLVEIIDLYKNSPPVENNPFPEIFKSKGGPSLKFNNNRSMLHYLLKREDCYCIGQKSLNLTNPSVLSGELKYLPIQNLNVHLNLGYITNENLQSNDIQEYFIDFIEKFFATL